MKLYLAPGACSLADHIALHEAGLEFERVTVNLRTHRTESGIDFSEINPKGYVPTLQLDDGQVLTENAAILFWIAQQAPQLAPPSTAPGAMAAMANVRLVEMLAFISTELHKTFGRILKPTSDADAAFAKVHLALRLDFVAGQFRQDYLFGNDAGVADAYLYVMLRWALQARLVLPPPLNAYVRRMETRPAVQQALRHERQEPVAPADAPDPH